jgi:ribulose kinase
MPQAVRHSGAGVTVAGAAVAGALATDVYNDVKAAGKAVVDKIRKPPPDPGPNMSQGGGGDAGPEAGRPS